MSAIYGPLPAIRVRGWDDRDDRDDDIGDDARRPGGPMKYDGFDNVAMEIDWDRMSPMELMPGPKIVITIALDNALPWDKETVLAKCLDAIEREADEADDALPILLMQGEWQ